MPVLSQNTLTALRRELPATAAACVDAIVEEVPGYHRAFDARLRHNIERAVQQALTTFLDLQDGTETSRVEETFDGARSLGQGEAASGRSTDALLAAYRVGARVSWQNFSDKALAKNEDAAAIAKLAAATFAFIDELSAASLAGHTEAMTRRTRELARRRDQLASALVAGENRATLERLAEQARWSLPTSLTALVIEDEPSRSLVAAVGDRALWTPATSGPAVALIRDLSPNARTDLLHSAEPSRCCLGPSVPWSEATESTRRAHRAMQLDDRPGPFDCETLLPELLLDADPRSAAHLAQRALAPLQDLTEAKQEILAETLLTWLLLQGRRDEVAASLHIHPQTVRYRMNQLRELYGAQLNEPRAVLELVLGLQAADLVAERSRR